ncbi:hypothetical protein [Streptomyces nigrescens]|uniref:hypothetical protein n=1 Tax=Streptomyces nigrescens TaxID=1920 RepID=UPI0036A1671D
MRELRSRGLAPKADKDLLPLLLDLIGDNVPVEEWPTRLTKTQRTEIAREEAQATAAAADRPELKPADEEAEVLVPIPRQSVRVDNVVELPWRQRLEQGQAAIDDVRRRRREAETHEVTASATLGQRLRGTRLRELLDDEADTEQEKTSDHL